LSWEHKDKYPYFLRNTQSGSRRETSKQRISYNVVNTTLNQEVMMDGSRSTMVLNMMGAGQRGKRSRGSQEQRE
jgi:hypothetical protein